MTTSRAAPTMMMTRGTETQPHRSQQRLCPVAGHYMRIAMVGAVVFSMSPSLAPLPCPPPSSPSLFPSLALLPIPLLRPAIECPMHARVPAQHETSRYCSC
jgi:hypothetical protein